MLQVIKKNPRHLMTQFSGLYSETVFLIRSPLPYVRFKFIFLVQKPHPRNPSLLELTKVDEILGLQPTHPVEKVLGKLSKILNKSIELAVSAGILAFQ